jgi:hypothetical protein
MRRGLLYDTEPMGVTAVAHKRNKVTVLLDSEEFERFQNYCEGRGFKKSTLIARLIREHLDAENFDMQVELPLGGTGQNRAWEEGDND